MAELGKVIDWKVKMSWVRTVPEFEDYPHSQRARRGVPDVSPAGPKSPEQTPLFLRVTNVSDTGVADVRRRRKKIPVSERQPLIRPGSPNEVWSADFVFNRIATGRTLKCLVIVDDATHGAVAIVVEHCMGGNHLARILDGICSLRRRPAVIRTDNGKEFTGKAMLT